MVAVYTPEIQDENLELGMREREWFGPDAIRGDETVYVSWDDYEAEVEHLNDRLHDLDRELGDVLEDNECLKDYLETANAEINNLNDQIRDLEKEIERLKENQ